MIFSCLDTSSGNIHRISGWKLWEFYYLKHIFLFQLVAAMARPAILVTRAVFPETLARLREHFEVQANQDDEDWNGAELIEHLQGKQGAFTTASVRIDAAVLAACPGLKICANMAVGYNNFDLAVRSS